MKVTTIISVVLALASSGCDSDTVGGSLQTTSETATVAVGEAEIVRAGGRLKLTATAELIVPLGGVSADITLTSTVETAPNTDTYSAIAGTFNIAPAAFDFERPSRFSVTAPENTDKLGVLWRATSSDEWIGLPSGLLEQDTNGDGVIDSRQLVAWVFTTGQIAAVRFSTDTGACCTNGSCNTTPKSACTGAYFGTGSSCTDDNAKLCDSQCCLSSFTPGTEPTSIQDTLSGCLASGLWPLGSGSTCETKCCSVDAGPGSVAKYEALCSDSSTNTSCSVCCIDNGTAALALATECTLIDTTGASCETICCASVSLSPVQGFARVTRTQCKSVSGLESFDRYCDLCSTDTDCQQPPTSCHDVVGACGEDGLCFYPGIGECTNGADCGEGASCTSDCTCE